MEDETLDRSTNVTFKYDRHKLLSLRESPASNEKPEVNKNAPTHLFNLHSPQAIQPLLMPAFVRNRQVNKNGTLRTNSHIDRKAGSPNYVRSSTSEIISKDDSGKLIKKNTIHVSLSLNKDVKLNETKNAWKPSHLNTKDSNSSSTLPSELLLEKEGLLRRVRGILNKLTPENFDKLVEEILALPIDTFEKVNGVMILVFEKAVDEPNFSVSYARLCKRVGDIKIKSKGENDPKLNFRTALLNKTELEFKNNVLNREAKEKRLQPIIQQMQECSDEERRAELKLMFEEADRKIRRRSGGTVCFIGELFKNSMLTGNIINCCILSLLDPMSEDKLECMCKLLTTVGAKFEKTINSKDPKMGMYKLDAVIKKIQTIVDQKTQYKISSRIRFMLQDVIDLRQKRKWISNRMDSSPKTIGEIQKDALAEQFLTTDEVPAIKKDLRRYGSTDNITGFVGRENTNPERGHSQQKLNDNKSWQTQVSRKNRIIDTNKLGSMLSQSNTNINSDTKLGNSSQYMWPRFTNNGIKQQPPSINSPAVNSFAALSFGTTNRRNNKSPRKNNTSKKGFSEKSRYNDISPKFLSPNTSRQSSRSNSPRPDTTCFQKQTVQPDNSISTTSPTNIGCLKSSSLDLSVIALTPTPTVDETLDAITSEVVVITETPESIQMVVSPNLEAYDPLNVDQNRAFLRTLDDMVDVAIHNKIEDCTLLIKQFSEQDRWGIFYNIFSEYLHLQKVKPASRKILAKICIFLLNNNYITMEQFNRAYKEFCDIASDIAIDVPNVWNYVFQFIGPFIHKKLLSVTDLWNSTLKEIGQGKSFVKEFINYCTREFGPNYTRYLWTNLHLSWTDFLDEEDIDVFITDNKFQFVANQNATPPLPTNYVASEIMDRLKEILNDDLPLDDIIPNYIAGNIANVDADFIRLLTTTLCDFVIEKSNKNCKLDSKSFQKFCTPLLHRYVDNKEDLELACLYAVQQIDYELEHPAGLLNEVFSELYDAEIISVESFVKWRDSGEERRGKGVAVKSLNPFFNSITSCEVMSDGSEY